MTTIQTTHKNQNGGLSDRAIIASAKLHRTFEYYKSQHRTAGCKWTHMFGVPLIVASFFVLPFNRRAFAGLQIFGWTLQLIGHYVFEHNKPVILEMRTPSLFAAALIFVWDEWKKFLSKHEV